jgi:hypothetical protein
MGTARTPQQPPQVLRQRAAALRRFAALIENAAVCRLDHLVGSDTWIGPAPNECANDVRLIRGRFVSSASGLRDAARLLELQAAAIPVQDAPH